MCVPQNYILKDLSKDDKSQLSSKMIKSIRPRMVFNGMWLIHSKSGYPGNVKNLKKIRTGKHGHTRIIFELTLAHNNSIYREWYHHRHEVKQALVEKKDYLVSYIIKPKMIINCFCNKIKTLYIPKEILDLIYLFYHNNNMNQVVCYNDDFKEINFLISSDKYNKERYDKLLKCIDISKTEKKECYVTVCELPMVSKQNENDIEILQIITDSLVIDPN